MRGMITFTHKGDFSKTEKFFERCLNIAHLGILDKYGKQGVAALAANTPVDSGKTASSWRYRVVNDESGIGIEWYNTNVNDGVPIAVIIQYGHGTGTGGYVKGIDYVNPAMKPILQGIADDVWKEVSRD